MQVFRIAKRNYINDLSGLGAELYGGRWNSVGVPVIYTSESRALASLEFLVHSSMTFLPNNLCIATINIPAKIKSTTINKEDLPKNWKEYPATFELAQIGSDWANNNKTLILRVPSVVEENEFNYMINPRHEAVSKIEIVKIENYTFDSRLVKKK